LGVRHAHFEVFFHRVTPWIEVEGLVEWLHLIKNNDKTHYVKRNQKERTINFSFFMNYTNYKKVFLNQDGEENSNAERIIRKNNNGIK